MPGLSRRELTGGVAMGSLIVSAAAAGETMQPPLGPAPAPLDGPELPSFRYPLGAQETKQFDGGTAKEATVVQFPVSEKLARVYMTLEPRGSRDVQWPPNAAEGRLYLRGSGRMTVFASQGRARTDAFAAGDVGYVPQG